MHDATCKQNAIATMLTAACHQSCSFCSGGKHDDVTLLSSVLPSKLSWEADS